CEPHCLHRDLYGASDRLHGHPHAHGEDMSTELLPLVFAALMGLAILAYVVLDGYDLGVGMLMAGAERAEQDLMVASIGPFWDANETWLVLGIGLLLVAFPAAHGVVLGALRSEEHTSELQ